MKILYIGENASGYFIEEAIEITDLTYTGNISTSEDILTLGLSDSYEVIVIDIVPIYFDIKEVIEKLNKIKEVNTNVNIIVYAKGYPTTSSLVIDFKNNEFNNIITEISLSDIKNSFCNFLENTNNQNTNEKI